MSITMREVSVDVRAFAGLANPPHLWVVETPVHPPARGPRVLDEAKRPPTLIANSDRSLPAALSIDKAPIGPPVAVAPTGAAVFTVLVWFSGVLLSVTWLGAAWLKLGLVVRYCQQMGSGSLRETLTAVAAMLDMRRPVTLVLSPHRAVPMTWGLWRPVVLLPEDALCWTGERVRAVLVHELGPVVRWDCLLQMVGHLARGLLWFHPQQRKSSPVPCATMTALF